MKILRFNEAYARDDNPDIFEDLLISFAEKYNLKKVSHDFFRNGSFLVNENSFYDSYKINSISKKIWMNLYIKVDHTSRRSSTMLYDEDALKLLLKRFPDFEKDFEKFVKRCHVYGWYILGVKEKTKIHPYYRQCENFGIVEMNMTFRYMSIYDILDKVGKDRNSLDPEERHFLQTFDYSRKY